MKGSNLCFEKHLTLAFKGFLCRSSQSRKYGFAQMPAKPNRFSGGLSLPRFVVICLGKGISVVDGRITQE